MLPLLSDLISLPGILDQPSDDFRVWLAERKEPALRSKHIRRWIAAARAETFEQISDLPKALRTDLAAHFQPFSTRVAQHLVATDDTHKLLLKNARRSSHRMCLDPGTAAANRLYQHAGRLRDGLCLLQAV